MTAPEQIAEPLSADPEPHLSEDFETRPEAGWFHARCICGWQAGPFPDAESSVDALMEHSYDRGRAARLAAIPAKPDVGERLDVADRTLAQLDYEMSLSADLNPNLIAMWRGTIAILRAALSKEPSE